MKTVIGTLLTILFIFCGLQTAYSEYKKGNIVLNSAVISAAAPCPFSLEGTWISSNRTPEDYETFITFTQNGVISEIGAFNVAQPPGTYQMEKKCSISATITEADNNVLSITGSIESDSSMKLSVDGEAGEIDFIKVSDSGACQGTWSGILNSINPPQPPSSSIHFQVDSSGALTSFTGLDAPVLGKMYCESNRGVAHLKTGESNDFRELILDGTLSGNSMTGVYGIDNSSINDPDGSFSISR